MSDITQRLAEEANKDGFDPARDVEVPAVPVADATPESLLRAVRAMKSLLDVREGRGGSILDKSLSLRDLYREGIVSISVKGELLTGGGGLVAGSGGGAGGTGGGIGTLPPSYYDDPRPILTVPPAPSNLSAVGAFRDIMLDWDLLNYRNHAHVEVWRASGTNSLGSATLIGQASANLFTDTSAVAGVTYYYWVRAVTIEGATGPYNAGAAGGVAAGLGLVGNSDLSNDIIEARHLQTGAVTAGKLAANAIVAGSAAIQDGAITNAKIGNLAVDNAKISSVNVGKLVAGSLAVGQHIRSQSYVAGASGWAINADGTAEFAFAHIRGTLLATQIGANSITADKINTNGLTVRDTNGNIILGAGSAIPAGYLPDEGRNNLIDLSWWRRGGTIPWSKNGPAEENTLYATGDVGGTGPRGTSDIVLYAREAAGDGEAGGGWDANNTLSLDPTKTYRFVVPIRKRDGSGGSAYWGVQGGTVCTLNTGNVEGNPYFAIRSRDSMASDRWHLFVGYVFPYGSTNNTHDGAGVYDCKTGALVSQGWNFCHASGGARGHRAYQFYAGISSTQLFGRPMVNLVDGTEPPLREFFEQGAVLNSSLSLSGSNGTVSLNGGGGGSVGGIVMPGNPINAGNASTYIANAAIGAAQIGSLSVGVLSTTMNGGSSVGIRMEQQKLQVFDGSGVRRGLFGYLG